MSKQVVSKASVSEIRGASKGASKEELDKIILLAESVSFKITEMRKNKLYRRYFMVFSVLLTSIIVFILVFNYSYLLNDPKLTPKDIGILLFFGVSFLCGILALLTNLLKDKEIGANLERELAIFEELFNLIDGLAKDLEPEMSHLESALMRMRLQSLKL